MISNPIEPVRLTFKKLNNLGDKHTLLTAWAKLLEAQDDSAKLFNRLALVADGLEKVINIVSNSQSIPEPSKSIANLCLVELRPLLIITNFSNSMTNFREHINVHKMNSLLMAGQMIELDQKEEGISENDIKSLTELVEKLSEFAKSGELPEALTKVLAPHISFIQWAVKNYEMIGIDGLMRTCAIISVGLSSIRTPEKEAASWHEKFNNAWQQITSIIINAHKAVRTARTALDVFQDAQSLLGKFD